MKKSHRDIPVQKGRIESNPMTSKQMKYPEKVLERSSELRELRRGQTLDLHSPKSYKK